MIGWEERFARLDERQDEALANMDRALSALTLDIRRVTLMASGCYEIERLRQAIEATQTQQTVIVKGMMELKVLRGKRIQLEVARMVHEARIGWRRAQRRRLRAVGR